MGDDPPRLRRAWICGAPRVETAGRGRGISDATSAKPPLSKRERRGHVQRMALAISSRSAGSASLWNQGFLPHPDRAAPARVRQGKESGHMAAEAAHGLSQGLAAAFQIIGLRVDADEKRQPSLGQVTQEPRMPERRAFRAGRQVPARSGAGVAKSHGNDRNAVTVVRTSFRRSPSIRVSARRCCLARERRSHELSTPAPGRRSGFSPRAPFAGSVAARKEGPPRKRRKAGPRPEVDRAFRPLLPLPGD